MKILLSVATSADGYIDDCSTSRLVLSTPEDWAEVYALRSQADAIVIGAETLRRDNPRLTLKSEELRANRIAAGKTAEPHRVIISRDGDIDPSLRIFSEGAGSVILFSTRHRPELVGLCEVIVSEQISASFIVTELEKRHLTELFVEGGAQIHQLFLESGCATALRIAVNPSVVVAEDAAPRFPRPVWLAEHECERSNLGGMEIEMYYLQQRNKALDIKYMQRAIELSRLCRPSSSSYCVGAVVVTQAGEIFEGYTHETSPTHHAEQEAIAKAEASGAQLQGATIYSSMEPCSLRSSEPESCSAIIIRHRFARALFALYEPSCFVVCSGALNMRKAGIEVECLHELGDAVRAVNSHLDF